MGKHIVIWLVALFLEFVAVALLSEKEALRERTVREIESHRVVLGSEAVGMAVQAANWAYVSTKGFAPRQSEYARGEMPYTRTLRRLKNGLLTSLDAGLVLIYRTVYRLVVITIWLPAIVVLVGAGIVDGIVERKRKWQGIDGASAPRANLAGHAVIIMSFAPLALIGAPVTLPALAPLFWAAGFTAVLRVAVSNVQHF